MKYYVISSYSQQFVIVLKMCCLTKTKQKQKQQKESKTAILTYWLRVHISYYSTSHTYNEQILNVQG